ncbi:MAG TPA: CBS domain-containing protein [Kofleriaceae bacterium]|jgi:acetoin utilization protein AcuB
MLMPTISRYMSRQPWTTSCDATLDAAKELMLGHGIRHLPVLEGGKLVGVVSHRDILRLERLRHLERHFNVGDAMTSEVYAVDVDRPVDEVAETMAEHKYGSAVVMNAKNEVLGVFTTTDAMQVLADVLRRATA